MIKQFPPNQLDLFDDTVATTLANDVIDALLKRNAEGATGAFQRLSRAAPDYPQLSLLQGLCQAVREWPYPADTANEIDETRRWLDEVIAPAALTVMPRVCVGFMRTFWLDLASAAERFPYDPGCSLAYAAPLFLKAGEPSRALQAADAVADGHRYPDVLAWQAEAIYRLNGLDASRSSLFRLALWAAPAFEGLVARLNDHALDRDWAAFRSSGLWQEQPAETSAEWFPAWFAIEHTDIRVCEPSPPMPSSPAAHALALVIAIRELEKRGLSPELIAARAQLRELDRDLFSHYMELRSGT